MQLSWSSNATTPGSAKTSHIARAEKRVRTQGHGRPRSSKKSCRKIFVGTNKQRSDPLTGRLIASGPVGTTQRSPTGAHTAASETKVRSQPIRLLSRLYQLRLDALASS
eukprot:scaffold88600_cov29-Tisochrysis_lutea.AAC.3